jgi:hypothetical protein
MKKRLLIILSIVLLVLVGVTLFFTLNSKERRLNIPHETIYSDFGALAKRKIQKLDSIPQTSPEEKAEFINGIDNKKRLVHKYPPLNRRCRSSGTLTNRVCCEQVFCSLY